MRRFARFVLALSLTLIVLIIASLLVSRPVAAPNPIEAYGFGICADRPCFLGIAPNVTKWTDITPELLQGKTIQSVSGVGSQNVSFFANGLGVGLTGQYNSPDVFVIKIGIFSGKPILVGDFVHYYGLPCAETANTSGQLELLYPYMIAMINTPQNQLDLNASVSRVAISDASSQYPGVKDWCAFVKQYSTTSGFQLIAPDRWLRWNSN